MICNLRQIAGAVSVGSLALAGCSQPGRTANTERVETVKPSSEVGRYTIVHSPHMQRDTILLDTVTGRTWQQVTYNDLKGDPTAWDPLYRADNSDELEELRKYNPPKAGGK